MIQREALIIFNPSFRFEKITDISIDVLKKLNIKAVFLDVDNTLCSHKDKKPINGAVDWVRNAEKENFKVYIVSNNFKERVSSIAKIYDLPFVSTALKPLPYGFNKAAKAIAVKKNECVIIGDQVFTDILGANLARMKSILVDPVDIETGITIRIRRYFERNIRKTFPYYKY